LLSRSLAILCSFAYNFELIAALLIEQRVGFEQLLAPVPRYRHRGSVHKRPTRQRRHET